jgi:isoleucyl-tRNA synthetase
MSKSMGNVVAPREIIDRYGAEILRLWVSASDYKDDVRISENILKQLSDAYRRIRNTSRFMLGNLFDFHPDSDRLDRNLLLGIDRFALHGLQNLVARSRRAYETYEFHLVYHALYNYCTLDLSAFYLDVLKDRLYTSPPASPERRSAQTAMYIILDTLAKLMAPILVFTAEEIWRFMPSYAGKAQSIHMTRLPEVNPGWEDANLAARWQSLLEVRGEVTKALEAARVQKKIGHSLDAAVFLHADPDLHDLLQTFGDELRSIFIVSGVSLARGPIEKVHAVDAIEGLSIRIEAAAGEKCERCWVHDPSVGQLAQSHTICSRCQSALKRIQSS